MGGGLRAAVMPVARKIFGRLGPLTGALRKAAPKANARLPLTPELIRTSIEESLRRLGTDRIEVYALHAVPAEEVGREEIRRALEDVVASGKARSVSTASDAAAAEAALAAGAPYGVVQLPLPGPGEPDAVLGAAAARGVGLVTHSILGETLARAVARARAEPELGRAACAAAGLDDPEAALASLLMARAFARNPEGVTLVSMLSPRSLARNVAAAEAPPPAGDALAAFGF